MYGTIIHDKILKHVRQNKINLIKISWFGDTKKKIVFAETWIILFMEIFMDFKFSSNGDTKIKTRFDSEEDRSQRTVSEIYFAHLALQYDGWRQHLKNVQSHKRISCG